MDKSKLSISARSLRLARFATLAAALLSALSPLVVFADNEADRLAARDHSYDYKSRKKRAQKDENNRHKEASESLDDLESLDKKDKDDKNNSAESKNNFDIVGLYGSQFKKNSFQDSDFSKHCFTDLLLQNGPRGGEQEFSPSAQADLTAAGEKKKKTLYGDKDHRFLHSDGSDGDREERKRHEADDDYERHFDEISAITIKHSPDISPTDWVPSSVDDTNNGGFGTGEDNGSPVPYKLNGHVDIERERPYRKNDDD